jgi:hypothetical protein
MTLQQHREAKRLIRSICSSCDNGNCIRLDAPCPQLHSASVSCRFFRNVLLKDAEAGTLEAEIFYPGSGKRCVVCGKLFYSTGNRAKYCEACKAEAQRKQKAEYAKRKCAGVEK